MSRLAALYDCWSQPVYVHRARRQVSVEEFIAAALDQRKVLNAKNINAIFGAPGLCRLAAL